MLETEMTPAVTEWLKTQGYFVAYERMICGGFCDVVGVKWEHRTSHRKPELHELVCVELKLKKIAEVLRQAKTNLYECHLSYCAMPTDFVDRMRPKSTHTFEELGIGLLSVDGDTVTEVITPSYNDAGPSKRMCNKLWNVRLKQRRLVRQEISNGS
jgi:hypothetical protein